MHKALYVFIALTYSFLTFANIKSINPDRVEYNLFDISSGYKKSSSEYYVRGVLFNQFREEYEHNGTSFKVDSETFESAKNRAESVFEATPGDSSSHFGTAFHVGGNLLFTNQHVLSVSRKNTTQCKNFKIKLNSNQDHKTLKCKKVHFCNKTTDFCLIEMFPHRRGQSLDKQNPVKLKRTVSLGNTTRVMSIGNTRGFGLHAATGLGLEDFGDVFKFYAPVFGGNSGGAIFNDAGEVIGVVRSQSKDLYGKESYNVAITIEKIYQMLKIALKDSPEILNEINFIN